MLHRIIETITAGCSGDRALDYARTICGFNRVQISEGYTRAAKACADILQSEGIEAHVGSVPLEKGTRLWSQRGFDEWNCSEGILRLHANGELLCDYTMMPTSLIQRSGAIDMPSVEIVLLDNGADMDNYPDIDMRGKLVFAPDIPYPAIGWTVRERGAAGIITDYITTTFTRDRSTMRNSRSYFNFSWNENDVPYPGFVITPDQGDALRTLCIETEEHWRVQGGDRYPRCEARVSVETKPGHIDYVEAFLPGTEDEEIIITAHLCHAMPCANDNASGCAGAMEAMTALHRMINSGLLPDLRYGIRMLLVPEVSGSFAWLASHEERIPHIMAAINLDMIGRKQEGRNGLLGIWAAPDALPSFTIDLMAFIRRLTDREAPSFNLDGYVTPFHTAVMEYNGGSDHYVYCDPSVGIPCITFMQWMDSAYHTSADTIDNLDPEMLHKSVSMASAWLYSLAAPDIEDLRMSMKLMRERFLKTLHRFEDRRPVPGIGLRDYCEYELNVFNTSCDHAQRFYGSQAESIIAEQKQVLSELAAMCTNDATAPEAPVYPLDERVPRRIVRGPLSFVGNSLNAQADRRIDALAKENPGLYGYHSINHFILFRVNGKRTVSEIARLVALEGRYNSPAYVGGYLEILHDCGMIEF